MSTTKVPRYKQENIAREIKRLKGDHIAPILVEVAAQEIKHSAHPFALACGLIHLESGFLNIYGHDSVRNPIKSPQGGVLRVTKANVQDYLRHRNAGEGSQGVGYGQLTYFTFQDRAMRLGGLWDARANLTVSFSDIDAMIKAYGERDGLAAYNAGPGNRHGAQGQHYADLVEQHVAHWVPVIGKKAK